MGLICEDDAAVAVASPKCDEEGQGVVAEGGGEDGSVYIEQCGDTICAGVPQ